MNNAGLDVQWIRFEIKFKKPARTSRGALLSKPSWLIRLRDNDGRTGWGECSVIPGLSLDDALAIESQLQRLRHSGEIALDIKYHVK